MRNCYRTLRVTWRRLTQQPEAFVASLAAALARNPALTPAAAAR